MEADIFEYSAVREAWKKITQKKRDGYKIALVGYSLGNTTITWLQRYLAVDLLLAISESSLGQKTKPEIALEQLRWVHEAGLPRGVALLDAGYGDNTALRDGITALEMPYAVGISATTTVWVPGTAPLPAKQRRSGRDRPAKRLRRNRKHRPLSLKALASRQPKSAWQTITWREGTAAPLASRFARLRVRPAHRDEKLTEPRPGGMAADRVARGREGAHQILALDLAGRHRICGACGYCQIALARCRAASSSMRADALKDDIRRSCRTALRPRKKSCPYLIRVARSQLQNL